MRNLLNVLLLLFVLTTVRAFGQETFAPLIGDNTVLFVHIDLRKVEIDTLKSQTEKFGEDLLKQLHFDEKSFKATTRELKNELEKLDALVRLPYETITKTFGIQELAIIADTDLLDNNITGVLVVPWKNKTKNDVEKLHSFLKTIYRSIPATIMTNDLLFFLFPVRDGNPEELDEVTKLTLIAWLQNITPSKESPIQQGLQVLRQDDEIKIVAALPKKLKASLVSNALPNNKPKEIQGFLTFAVQKIEWGAMSLPINTAFSDENENNVLLTIKTLQQSDAVQLRGLLEYAIEFGISTAQFAIKQKQKNEPELPPLFFEFLKGTLRTLLPDIDNDKLVFRLQGESAVLKQRLIGGIAVALLLPAVQAATQATEVDQEKARRLQCLNNLKQITIGIHNYHDVYKGLPPLYTVDENGKPLHSWRVLILPFIEQTALYQKIRINEPWDSEYNKQFHNAVIDTYRCPSNTLAKQIPGACCYSAIADEGFIPAKNARIQTGKTFIDIKDGTSNTLALVEMKTPFWVKNAGTQTGGTFARITDGISNTLALVEVKTPFCWMDLTADVTLEELLKGINNKDGRVGSFHSGGILIAFFDGSVRFLPDTVSKEILKALGTCAGGERVTFP